MATARAAVTSEVTSYPPSLLGLPGNLRIVGHYGSIFTIEYDSSILSRRSFRKLMQAMGYMVLTPGQRARRIAAGAHLTEPKSSVTMPDLGEQQYAERLWMDR